MLRLRYMKLGLCKADEVRRLCISEDTFGLEPPMLLGVASYRWHFVLLRAYSHPAAGQTSAVSSLYSARLSADSFIYFCFE